MSKSLDKRHPYPDVPLTKETAHQDAIQQFQAWFDDAIDAKHVEPNAMTLATATPDGLPTARMVLLKEVDQEGFIFYTNYDSHKGQQIAKNPRVALVFYWDQLTRQVRVEGTVEKVDDALSDQYFQSRPRDSQIGAWASDQSSVIESRELLEEKAKTYQQQYEGEPIPRPPYWGGYRVKPLVIEFWQGRPSRLHDRLRYTRQPTGQWEIERLAP